MEERLRAIAHEVGNLLAAVRLQAHGVEHDQSPRELAASVVSIDAACARAGALVALIQPIASGSLEPRPVSGAQIMETLREELIEQGTRGAELRIEIADGLPEVEVAPAALHSALLLYALASVDAVGVEGRLRIRAESDAEGLSILVEDSAPESLAESRSSLRGRGLAIALLEDIARMHGGRADVESGEGRNLLRVRF